jgi:hypothetical protein
LTPQFDISDLQGASAANFQINPDGTLSIAPIPEPASGVLLVGALAALLGARRRRSA